MAGFRILRDPEAFSNAPAAGQKRPRKADDGHLRSIRQLPCCVCGSHRNVEAAHLRMPSIQFGKAEAGIGAKPDDAWTTPLCADHHRLLPNSQHNIGEKKFWELHSINPFILALSLWKATGDDILMETIVTRSRNV